MRRQPVGQSTLHASTTSHPNMPPITSTTSPSFPSNKTSSKTSIKHSYYTKDLITNSWHQTRPPPRLNSTSAASDNLALSTKSTKSVSPLRTSVQSPSSTAKPEHVGSEVPPDVDIFPFPGSLQGSGTPRQSPRVLGRPYECSPLVGGTSSSFLDNDSPICQVCMSMLC